jgi:hypothetical protein
LFCNTITVCPKSELYPKDNAENAKDGRRNITAAFIVPVLFGVIRNRYNIY